MRYVKTFVCVSARLKIRHSFLYVTHYVFLLYTYLFVYINKFMRQTHVYVAYDSYKRSGRSQLSVGKQNNYDDMTVVYNYIFNLGILHYTMRISYERNVSRDMYQCATFPFIYAIHTHTQTTEEKDFPERQCSSFSVAMYFK